MQPRPNQNNDTETSEKNSCKVICASATALALGASMLLTALILSKTTEKAACHIMPDALFINDYLRLSCSPGVSEDYPDWAVSIQQAACNNDDYALERCIRGPITQTRHILGGKIEFFYQPDTSAFPVMDKQARYNTISYIFIAFGGAAIIISTLLAAYFCKMKNCESKLTESSDDQADTQPGVPVSP